MSTPPNTPSTPSGPPTEPAGVAIPEDASIPAPAQPLSLTKPPAQAAPPAEAPADTEEEAPADAPADAPAPAAPAAPAPTPHPTPTAFAPVTPAPPAAPAAPAYAAPYAAPYGAPGGPGAPANPWAAPAGGGYPAAQFGYPAPPPPANGMAVAALVLGAIGILVGLIPFLFWAGGLLGLTALGLGIAAVVRSRSGAPRGTMAAVGTVLGLVAVGASVGGYFLTQAVVGKIDESVSKERRRYEDSAPLYPSTPPKPVPSPSPTQVPGLTSALPFGQTFKYPSGVEVKLSAPKKYVTDNEYIKVGNAVQVTVTITNNSAETLNVIYSVPNLRDEQGLAGKMVFDGDMPKMIKGDILPGASATGVIAYEVPKGTANLTADITPGGRLPSVKYAGPIG